MRLQQVVHRVGEAVRRVVPTEPLYILSLGSRQANRHVHWHLAPLPPGVPLEQQRLAALDAVHCVDLELGEPGALGARIRSELRGSDPSL